MKSIISILGHNAASESLRKCGIRELNDCAFVSRDFLLEQPGIGLGIVVKIESAMADLGLMFAVPVITRKAHLRSLETIRDEERRDQMKSALGDLADLVSQIEDFPSQLRAAMTRLADAASPRNRRAASGKPANLNN